MKRIAKYLALFFYKHIDSNGFIYYSIKELSAFVRAGFYVSLIVAMFYFMKFIGSFIHLESYNLNNLSILIFELIGKILLVLTLLITALIIFYESIFNIDVVEELEVQKANKQRIKEQKKQWWRLRNMSFFARVIIYLIIYYITYQTIQFFSFFSFVKSNSIATEADAVSFIAEVQYMMGWYTFIYFIGLLTLEYFTRKKIQK